jgi:hypothetical protein
MKVIFGMCTYVRTDGCAPRYRLNGWTDFIYIQYSSVYQSQVGVRRILIILGPNIEALQMGSENKMVILAKTALMILINFQ